MGMRMLEQLTLEQLTEVAERLRALGEPRRRLLLQCLAEGERTVGELATATGLMQPNVSQHLATLAQAGWVTRRREGNRVYVSLCEGVAEPLCGYVCALARRSAAELAAEWPGEQEGSGT